MSSSRWMDKKAVVHTPWNITQLWKECIWIRSNEVDETGAYYTEQSKSERKTPIQYINAYIWNLERWLKWPHMRDHKRDTDVKNSLLDSVGEGEGGMIWENGTETCILSRVKQITSPVWMHETSAQAWCTGKTQRDRVDREVGGGIGMGNTCKSVADSCQCMTKPTTIL